jgi:hypothetical protein
LPFDRDNRLRHRGVPGGQISIMLGHRPTNASHTDLIYASYEPGYCAPMVRAIDAIYRDIACQSACGKTGRCSEKCKGRSGGRDRD